MTDGLSSCDREPIHIPGSIQSHGLMLVVDPAGLQVCRAAGDIERRLGLTDFESRPLSALLGETLTARIAAFVQSGGDGSFIGQLTTISGEFLDVSAHLSGAYVLVELEPAQVATLPASLVLDRLEAASAGFERAATMAVLCDRAAKEFRQLTGFDRVMVYQFLDDDVGRVVAEDRREDLRSFLNQHFPGSDIPRQARALYLRNLTRVIPDIYAAPQPLRPAAATTDPLDMSDSSLRSVSPVHLQYLHNMGVRASASISIVKDDLLWGLIACHHDTPRLMTFDVRATCRALAGALARQIRAKEEAKSYRQRIRLRGIEDEIVRMLSKEDSIEKIPDRHLLEMSTMLHADGVAVLQSGEFVAGGICPSESGIRSLAAWIMARPADGIISTNHLTELYPPAETFRGSGSGLLALTVCAEMPWLLLWFRAEQIETINWAGNPHEFDQSDPTVQLGPRASFDAWRETVHGYAQPWTSAEIDSASRLRSALIEVRQTWKMHALNRHLTGILRDKDVLLEQKEALVQEVNHRVQNSLQLVSSFLGLQARTSKSAEVHAALEEAGRRLHAVGLVHRRLYRGDQIHMINTARYIEELCADATSSMGQEWEQYLSLDLAPMTLSTDRAVTLGLVLTEQIININKHAYAGQAGPVEIRLTEERANFRLVVADRGCGKATSRKGFGTRMVDALVAQLGGELVHEPNHPGLRAVLTAPIASRPRSM